MIYWYLLHRHKAEQAHTTETPEANAEEQVALQQQLRSLRARMEAAMQLNSSLQPQLQLQPDELMLNTNLRCRS